MESRQKESRLWVRFEKGKLTQIFLLEGFSQPFLRERWLDLLIRIYLEIAQKHVYDW